MSKILLSGATGFLGSHLLKSFLAHKYEVVILKRSTSSLWRLNSIEGKYTTYDINHVKLSKIFEIEKPDLVVHTACSYGRNNESLHELLKNNLIFGIGLLDESIKNNVTTFINTDTLLPKNVNDYALSKAQFSEWLMRYSKQIQVINLKVEHMFGVNDDKTKFLPWLIDQMVNAKEIPLTSGVQKRDFIYIDDVVSAFNLVIKKKSELVAFEELHVGTGIFTEVRQLVKQLAQLVSFTASVEVMEKLKFDHIEYRENEVMVPQLDNTKLVNLGWHPDVTVQQGLEKIIKDVFS